MHLRSRVLPWVAAAAMLLTRPGAAGESNEQASSSANAAQRTAGQQAGQPPVRQPSLTVDRDPVASPDPDAPAARGGDTSAAQAGQITREGGRYTLRADAYEVRLNAT